MIDIMFTLVQVLPHRIRIFRKGQYLFHQGDVVASMFLIESGEARLLRRRPNGGAVVLQRALSGSCLAEASLFAKTYHCDAIATARVCCRIVSRREMRQLFENDQAFAAAWASHLADEVRKARLRAEILSLQTISERLDAWAAANGSIPQKGNWKNLAQEIGTSPEALYRELSRRRKA